MTETAAAPPPAAHWSDPLDAETKGYLQNRGWDKLTADAAFVEAAKAHREAEKFIGAPAAEMLRLPKDPASPDWANVWKRLGVPADPKEYDFNTIKRANDQPVDAALADTLRAASAAGKLTKEGAAEVAKAVVKHLDATESTRAAEAAANIQREKELLKANWGMNEAANMVVARAAATALGIKPEVVATLEKQAGYAAVMDMFRQIGEKIGEARFINPPAGGAGVMTRDQAVAEKASLQKDTDWVKRYLNGGVAEGQKMLALNRIITGISAA